MKLYVFAAVLSCLALSPAAAAEPCALEQTASLPLSVLANGRMAIPVTVAGTERKFLVSLNGSTSAILGSLADEKGFKAHNLPSGFSATFDGKPITSMETVSDIHIGALHGTDFQMLRYEKVVDGDDSVAGELRLDVLADSDIELDLRNKRLNLFSQDHCPGKVVYWSRDYASLPFAVDPSGHMVVQMLLDGKPVTIDFDAIEGSAYMTAAAAKRTMGLTEQSPGFSRVRTAKDGNAVFSYPFKSLAMEGVTIANPQIEIDAGIKDCVPHARIYAMHVFKCFGRSDVSLRANELRSLRLYIAFKERIIYVTAADAHL